MKNEIFWNLALLLLGIFLVVAFTSSFPLSFSVMPGWHSIFGSIDGKMLIYGTIIGTCFIILRYAYPRIISIKNKNYRFLVLLVSFSIPFLILLLRLHSLTTIFYNNTLSNLLPIHKTISKEKIQSIEELTKTIHEYEGINGIYSYREYIYSVDSRISTLINNSTGEDQLVYKNFKRYTAVNSTAALDWYVAYDSILQSARILDHSILHDQKEIEYQIDILKHYKTETESFKSNFENRQNLFNELNKDIPKDNPTLKYFMKGIRKKDSTQKPIFERFIKTHIYYSTDLLEITQFLKTNIKKWKYLNGELTFDSPNLEKKYDELLDKIGEDEFEISEWATFNLIEVL